MENKIKCPHCNEFECFVEHENGISSYICVNCGYTTNSTFTIESTEIESWEQNTPILVRNLKILDIDTGLLWYPCVIHIPSRGMIFPEGSENSWFWRVAKIIKISEENKSNYPIPGRDGEFYESLLDIENASVYDKHDFKRACIELKMFEEN